VLVRFRSVGLWMRGAFDFTLFLGDGCLLILELLVLSFDISYSDE
jgi:hypothetical protein